MLSDAGIAQFSGVSASEVLEPCLAPLHLSVERLPCRPPVKRFDT